MSIELTWLGHATWLINDGVHRILLDPFLNDSPTAPHKASEVDADFILVSHGHLDHVAECCGNRKSLRCHGNCRVRSGRMVCQSTRCKKNHRHEYWRLTLPSLWQRQNDSGNPQFATARRRLRRSRGWIFDNAW